MIQLLAFEAVWLVSQASNLGMTPESACQEVL